MKRVLLNFSLLVIFSCALFIPGLSDYNSAKKQFRIGQFDVAAYHSYNSLLKNCSNKKNIGKTSGLGFALGYLGSVPIIFICLYLFILPEKTLFNLDKNNFEHIRFIPFIVALWFLIFSFPMIYYFKNKIKYATNYHTHH